MSLETIRWGLKYKQRSGVYAVHLETDTELIMQLAEELNYNFFYIDGTQIQGANDFFAVSRVALMFPDYCSNNWDGFYDCLRDLHGVPEKEADIIFFDHFDQFARMAFHDFRRAYWKFETVVYERCVAKSSVPLWVMLRGDEEYIPKISYFDEGFTL